MMSLIEAIQARHSVRKYNGSPISEELIAILQHKIDEVNNEGKLHIQLITNEPKVYAGIVVVKQQPSLQFAQCLFETLNICLCRCPTCDETTYYLVSLAWFPYLKLYLF